MKKTWWIWLVLGINLLVLVGGFLLVRGLLAATLQPISDASSRISTQVSSILNPTPTILPDPVTIINQVRPLARLETILYSVEKIITAEEGQELVAELFGDRLLLVAHGTVISGVDLSKLTAEDLEFRDGILSVRLPVAEVFSTSLDNDKTYVYDRDTGLLRKADRDLETLARQAAEAEILQAAIDDGILDQAAINAQVFLDRLLNDLGYSQVIFNK
ncbi:MAG: DUF4230 domain-containing protein [Anaerolineaceae bacterium]|nr:DUF4230 domain-containing protein [Anaerolineaceae bacterium]